MTCREEKTWKIDKNSYHDTCDFEVLGKEKLNEFIQECLIKVGFLDTIKKNEIKTGIKSEKKCQKIEDFQSLEFTADISLNLEEPSLFLITTALLSTATPDGMLRQAAPAKIHLFQTISLKNQKHYMLFYQKILHGFLTVWL